MTVDLLLDMSDVETVPDFLLDNVNLHAWVDGSEVQGQAGYGVYFPHGEYLNISRPVVGPQANNRAEVSAGRAALGAGRGDQELCMYSGSKWCVDIFDNLNLYKRRGWMTQGKRPVRHHDIWEEVLSIIRSTTAPVTMTHVYGHNKIVYNEAADELAKAGAAQSKVHQPVRPRKAPDDGPSGRRPKQTRGQGVKRQASVQGSDDRTDVSGL